MSAVHRDKRWPAVRLAAKRRDGWRCVKCGARGRIEVDHIESVHRAPERAFDLSNLQTLCVPHHLEKTKSEFTGKPLDPKRREWRELIGAMAQRKELQCLTA